ncbi:MAG: PAS domain-containing protein [Deltaproteobacteria bacterium]|nr:PAS domain-containing protein [Deltaproteobacteria bacterium]
MATKRETSKPGRKSEKTKNAMPSSDLSPAPIESEAVIDAASPVASRAEDVEPIEARKFPIVGIGASAGGLEALERFFRAAPPGSDMAFVVIVHLDRHHVSLLPQLLQNYTSMKVLTVEDGMAILPNQIYVAPSNKDMIIMKGVLHLLEIADSAGLRLPIDDFFQSLALDQGEDACCIILSGTGSDGSSGLKVIKSEGGLVLVQDEDSAKYNGMPRSAISTGMVDFVLPPDEMPERLIKYRQTTVRLGRVKTTVPEPKVLDDLPKIFALVRARTGHDFSSYKLGAILRRIKRRMGLNQIEQIGHYVSFLRQNPGEVDTLFRDILIGVTSFFRDKEAFQVLRDKLLPQVLAGLSPPQTFRAWVVGCSTGEEAYSIAITIRECLNAMNKEINFQVFATDIDNFAIAKAREGSFPLSISAEVSPEILNRYFIKENSSYLIKKEIRESMVFAVQDVLKDAPFSRLDLLSCRNLLIYMENDLQKKLFPLFHYVIKEGGILLLGPSESIGSYSDLFTISDKKWRIYKRQPQARSSRTIFDFPVGVKTEPVGFSSPGLPVRNKKVDLIRKAQEIVLERFSPTCILIDAKGEIQHIQGKTGKYLEHSSGLPGLNLLSLAREGLRPDLDSAIRKAAMTKGTIVVEGLRVKTNGDVQPIKLTVMPIRDIQELADMTMVVFQDVALPEEESKTRIIKGAAKELSQRLAALDLELREVRENHQIVVEELETSNEELKSLYEEMQSSNEELQSANEELGASREEQQSMNEELQTVNAELQSKVDELSQVHNYLKNTLNSTDIATIFLDTSLLVRRFTPHASKIANLIDTDVRRPIGHIATNLEYSDLVKDAKMVLDTLIPKETEVRTSDGHWYLMRILPYRTTENQIDGVVITFFDVTESKLANEQVKIAKELAYSIVDMVRDSLLVLDSDLKVIRANRTFFNTFKVTAEETHGRTIYDLGNGQWNIPKLRDLLGKGSSENASFGSFEIEHQFPDIGRKRLRLLTRSIQQVSSQSAMILLAIEDVTDNKTS